MTEPIYARLAGQLGHAIADDWQRAVSHLHHHGVTIAPNPPQPAQKGPLMSLKTILDEGKTLLEDGESKVRQFLDEHVPQLAELANLIESNPIFTSVEAALHVPAPLLDGVAKMLDALAAQYPKPGGQDQAAAAEVPAEPQSA